MPAPSAGYSLETSATSGAGGNETLSSGNRTYYFGAKSTAQTGLYIAGAVLALFLLMRRR